MLEEWAGPSDGLSRRALSLPLIVAEGDSTETAAYLLALAQGLTGTLAVAAAILTFVAERTVRRFRARDPVYMRNLILLILISAVTAVLSALTWWVWDVAATDVSLLFGWSGDVWLGLVFGGALVVAASCMIAAAVALARYLHAGRKSTRWQP